MAEMIVTFQNLTSFVKLKKPGVEKRNGTGTETQMSHS